MRTSHISSLHRPILSLGIAAALALSACGAGTTQTVGGDDLLAPTPVHVAASGATADGAAASNPLATLTEGAAADDTGGRMGMIAPWVVYNFILGSGMPALPTEANGWKYAPDAAPDLGRVAQIAAVLGVGGDPVARSADLGGGWIVGPDDGTAPALYVAADGQLSWWFSAPYPSLGVATGGCARPEEPAPADNGGSDGSSGAVGEASDEPLPPPADDCVFEEPQPPTGILTADQARARATDLLGRLGVDPAQFDLEVYADDWYASVSAMQRLGSMASPVGWYFGFGEEGRLDYAGGTLAQPVEVGPYPLIDIEAALARLTDGYYGGIMPLAADTAVSSVGLGAPDVMCEEGADCELPTEPEQVDVTLTDVRQDLWWTWDSDGTVWLLPAFTFLDADGGRYTVPAVTDEYLIIDDVLVDPAVDEPAPAPSDPGVTGEVISDTDAATLIGLTEDEALDTASALGWTVRIVERDGEQYAVTDDYSTTRVNLTISGGYVKGVTVG